MNINRRLEAMRERLERSRPCRMVVTFKSGEIIETAGQVAALKTMVDYINSGEIVSVTADRPEYEAMANLMYVLCHPAPNRAIMDYE